MRNYLVIFQPIGCETVNTMRVVDAWASSGTLQDARQTVRNNLHTYKNVHGRGSYQVVEEGPASKIEYI